MRFTPVKTGVDFEPNINQPKRRKSPLSSPCMHYHTKHGDELIENTKIEKFLKGVWGKLFSKSFPQKRISRGSKSEPLLFYD
ncbi:hypothetical protein Dalk_2521 [Desulfatibacillum aliphaticivorans]|uniref:Uncharacterized protein n=1 Tax=Desulfatibacillum aliphaticivorans TaxID=218208 RepID=B8FFF4_DESAL|nr:hypothetical protein Dalk_2521 [Desulfatibacillum aliphaticivorans]